jgi:AcrR family transcriptional regulator
MPRPAQPILSRERIAAVGLRLVDRDGLDGLSIRLVAAEMGVSSAALYYHFDNKDSILNAVIEKAMRAVVPPDPTQHWTDQVSAMCYSYRDTLIAHPNLAPAMVRLTSRRFGGRIVAGLARAMAIDGVPAGLIPTVLNSFEIYVFGAGVSAKADYEKFSPATLTELDDFPEVADALLTTQGDEASFREGLQALLTGWQSRIASLQQR